MAKLPPVHQDSSKLTEVPEADHKEIKKHFNQSVFVLEPASADHIASNIYVRKRNFSFRAAVTLLQSRRVDLFTNEDHPSGYIAYGSPEPSGHHEDRYVRKGRLAVVFKLKYNDRLKKKESGGNFNWVE